MELLHRILVFVATGKMELLHRILVFVATGKMELLHRILVFVATGKMESSHRILVFVATGKMELLRRSSILVYWESMEKSCSSIQFDSASVVLDLLHRISRPYVFLPVCAVAFFHSLNLSALFLALFLVSDIILVPLGDDPALTGILYRPLSVL